jgi:hypothetical protein
MSCLVTGGSFRLATVGRCSVESVPCGGESIQFVSNKPINETIESTFRPLELWPVPPLPPRLGGAYGLRGRRSIFEIGSRRSSGIHCRRYSEHLLFTQRTSPIRCPAWAICFSPLGLRAEQKKLKVLCSCHSIAARSSSSVVARVRGNCWCGFGVIALLGGDPSIRRR